MRKRERENEKENKFFTSNLTSVESAKKRKIDESEGIQLSEEEERNRGSREAALQARKDCDQLEAEGCFLVTEIENKSPAYIEAYQETYEKVKTAIVQSDNSNTSSTTNAHASIPQANILTLPQPAISNSFPQAGMFYGSPMYLSNIHAQLAQLNLYHALYIANAIEIQRIANERIKEEIVVAQMAKELMSEMEKVVQKEKEEIEYMADELKKQVEAEVKNRKENLFELDNIQTEEDQILERILPGHWEASATIDTNWCDFFQSKPIETGHTDILAPESIDDDILLNL